MLWPGLLTGTLRRPKVSRKQGIRLFANPETFGRDSGRVGRPCHNARTLLCPGLLTGTLR